MPTSCCAPQTEARTEPACELADIFRRYGPAYRAAHRLPLSHLKVMSAVEFCRTAALGGHRETCAHCDFVRYAYNSCRNRHCPKCQALVKAKWLEARRAELLPVGYFHNVFTLPHELNRLILCRETNQRHLLNLLFRAASQTLLQFGRNNLGGTLGTTMVLHTWDQLLRPHFHVHCLIPGGVLSADKNRWRPTRKRFLFSVKALSKVFRAKFLDGLHALYHSGKLLFPASVADLAPRHAFTLLLRQLRDKDWVVYSKAPFAGPEKLLDYLGRYTHRVALSNSRLVSMEDGQVRFTYYDRADGGRRKVDTLSADEFIHRFLKHTLPSGFVRIRHYGLLASRRKKENLDCCRTLLHVPTPPPPENKTTADLLLDLLGIDIDRCPQCGQPGLLRTRLLPGAYAVPRPPHHNTAPAPAADPRAPPARRMP